MQEIDRLLTKKQELEQLIKYNQEHHLQSSQWGSQLSSYASHPADMAAHLQLLNIELEKINAALEEIQQNPSAGYDQPAPELH